MHQSVEGITDTGAGGGAVAPVMARPRRRMHAPPQSVSLVPTRPGWTPSGHTRAKRAIDIAGATLALAVALPVLLLAAVMVFLTSPGPVLFRQWRVGLNGQHFRILKFRTFPVDHVDREQSLPQSECPSRLGRFLRRTSIDELPQLWNVLRGEMSLVGPRPERPHFAEALGVTIPGYRERHRAPAGITGHAQIKGLCGPTSIFERVQADNEYIETWTVWSDVRILLRTVPTVFRKIRW